MARTKAFDPGEATKEAMQAFWQHGYHATSVSDLLSEMKLNRGSLYATFGDKKQLFMAALDEYERQGREALREALEKPGSAREAICDWVEAAAAGCSGQAGHRGCLALKAALEMAPHDCEVADWIKRVTRERQQMIAKAIRRGQGEGRINPRLDPRATARYLISCLAGLRVLGTASPSAKDVRQVVELMLRVLD